MIGLWYLLGFLSGIAAGLVAMLIVISRKRKNEAENPVDEGFLSILKY